MKTTPITVGLALAVAIMTASAGAGYAGSVGALKVTFKTTSCTGDTGVGSVDVDRITRIQKHNCGTATAPGPVLKQVLVESNDPQTQYSVYLVTEEEAGNIQAQIDSYMASRKKGAESSSTVVIEHNDGRDRPKH